MHAAAVVVARQLFISQRAVRSYQWRLPELVKPAIGSVKLAL
jgi:hypothetical protein